MQFAKLKWPLFTNLFLGKFSGWNGKPQELPEFNPSSMSRTCRNVSMDEFLCQLCEGEQIMPEENWTLVLAEFYELRGILPHPTLILSRDITKLRSHLSLLYTVVEEMRYRYSDMLAGALKNLGYSYKKNAETHHDQLDLIVNRSKTKYIQLQQLVKQLDEQLKKLPAAEQKPKREYFESLLGAIEEMQRVAYSMETMMVIKFTQLEKKYWAMVAAHEHQKQVANGRNRSH